MADNVQVTEGSGKTIATDDVGGEQYQRVKIDLGGDGVSSPFTGTLTGITNSVAVHLLNTGGTLQVKLDPSSTVQVSNTVPISGSLTGITNSVAVHLLSTGGTLQVKLDPSSAGNHTDDTAFDIGTDVGSPVMALFDDSSPDSVDENDVGVIRMTGNRILMSHLDTTASIFTVSGSTSGVSASGTTLISPSANASFKIFAYSIQTTGLVSLTAKFTNGSGASPTEFWRPLVTAASSSSSPVGANLTTMPSAPLFVTGVSTTLSLVLDTATLVHYSVSYTKESA